MTTVACTASRELQSSLDESSKQGAAEKEGC